MHRKKFLLIFLFILLQLKAFSAVFVVTSNADSGPGTLRDALTQAAANGSATKDYINFNLPDLSIAGRTITVVTQLPDVTGNVIIDGTTQPGLAFGVSNAKIIITIATPVQGLNAFNIGYVQPTDAVEFYGLYIKGFTTPYVAYGGGIVSQNNCELRVGAPGKGNVICGNNCAILSALNNAIIQSNFLGVEPDGETPLPNQSVIYAGSFNNVLIGGDDPTDGNVIVGGFYNNEISIGDIDGESGTTTDIVTIKNNYFGIDYLGARALTPNTSDNYIHVYLGSITLNVLDNVFSAASNGIWFQGNGFSNLNVMGNYFGTNRSESTAFGKGGQALDISGFVTAVIGGNNATDQNVFTNYGNPIFGDNIAAIDVIKNKFYCNDIVALYYIPTNLKITKLLDNEVAGDAPPGSIVQLYYVSTECADCNPKTWFANITADGTGNWDYKGDTRQNIMVSATSGGSTVGFQPLAISDNEVTITNIDCHHPGSIMLNENRTGRLQITWTDANGVSLGHGQEIDNLQPGTYNLLITEGGSCPSETGRFTVADMRPHAQPGSTKLECGNTTTTFTPYLNTYTGFSPVNYYWEDAAGNPISSELAPKLPVGTYLFYFTDSNGCSSEKVTIQILPQDPLPTLDDSKAVVTDADCGGNDGTITGLIIKNVLPGQFAGWFDSFGTFLSYGPDLTNVPPGQYTYSITYDYNCTPLVSRVFTVGIKNSITMDESAEVTTNAACGNPTGSITGIQVTGATAYVWTDANNKTYTSATADLTNIPPGSYTLTVSNIYGCSKTSKTYTVTQPAPTQYPAYTVTQVQPCFGQSDGSLTIATDFLVKSERWVNSQNQSAGSGPVAANLPADTYQLFLTDNNGCESAYGFYSLQQLPQLQFLNTGLPLGSTCGLSNGSITDVQVAGGMPPYTYKWTNADTGVPIGTNSNTITNLSSGNFNLEVTDSRCGNTKVGYFIADDQTDISTPAVTNVELCSSGGALVKVNNPVAGSTYRLYDTPKSQQPLAENETGQFTVSVTANRSFYITQAIGTCESSRAQVDVSVGISAINIANTFTPNGDNINDYWVIKNIENYPNALVQVFNRYGQKLFESKGYGKPFDGTYNGQKLPSGVYYYIINLSKNCNLLSGSLTIVR